MVAKYDDRTKRLDMPLPNADNFLQDDVARLIETINDLDGQVATLDAKGKLEVSQVPDVVPQLDAKNKLADSMMPDRAVMLDATGKIPVAQLPNEGTTSTMNASSEQQMLALNATVGDICDRLDTGFYYILVDQPASSLSNWRVLPRTVVTSINGETGAVTGYAKLKPIANAVAMALEGVNGPLRLNAEGTDPYDAVTFKQLQTVQAVASGGASMNGIMNNFIGAVEWFNGSRAALPAGYIVADGQEESRTDEKTKDLWAAVEKGMFVAVDDDAAWTDGNRGSYVKNSPTSGMFRVPDLNGAQKGSIKANYLAGDGYGFYSVGGILRSSAPNITGRFAGNSQGTWGNFFAIGTDAFRTDNSVSPTGETLDVAGASQTPAAGRYNTVTFDAARVNAIYGRDNNTTDLRPNTVYGIWIIRANGNFQAANTSYQILNSDTAEPANGTVVKSGMVGCYYKIGDATRHFTNLQSTYKWGDVYASAMLGVGMNDKAGTMTVGKQFEFRSNGDFLAPGGIYGVVIRSDSKRTGIRNTTGGSVQSRIVNQLDNSERAAFGMYSSVGDTASELRYGNLSLTSDGKITKTWSFDMSGTFTSPGPVTANGPYNAVTTGGTVALATGIYPTYVEINILNGASGLPLGARAIPHTSSDVRKKTNIKTIPAGKALADMAMVRPVSFSFKANVLSQMHPELPRSYGVIAQELEQIVPDAVMTLSDGMKELDLTVISGFMLATIKDLMAQLKAQSDRIAKLEAKLGS
ncbi:TPA: tail fiber domain-containing protein [Escherichia coli]